jgi:hypothetical protein
VFGWVGGWVEEGGWCSTAGVLEDPGAAPAELRWGWCGGWVGGAGVVGGGRGLVQCRWVQGRPMNGPREHTTTQGAVHYTADGLLAVHQKARIFH